MWLQFSKFQGAGNDFIMVNDRSCLFPVKNSKLISGLCSRHFGVGADGLILLRPSSKYDFKMVYFNSDGREGTMCGNGGRCVVAFAEANALVDRSDRIVFEAIDGRHEAEFKGGRVRLKMKNVDFIENNAGGYFLDTGSVHHVVLVDSFGDNFLQRAEALRRHKIYRPDGVNVDLARVEDRSEIQVRTFERGVEAETLACGTGAVASALVCHFVGRCDAPVRVKMTGGMLDVDFENDGEKYSNIWLTGPADFVFRGQVEV